MQPDARVLRMATRTLAQSYMGDVTVTDSGKDDDGNWWLLVRDESHQEDPRRFPPYYRITLSIEDDQ